MELAKVRKLCRWLKSLKKEPEYFRGVHVVKTMSAVPSEIGRDIYIVEKGGRRVWAVFNCPCERGHRIVVNLSRSRRPHWGVSVRRGLASFWPSLWLKQDCKSHFWIRNSRIYWAISDLEDPWDEI
jgi:Family of unknown function (DUF6527)